jgi:hypothetical protein
MRAEPPVQPRYGPTLPELLAPYVRPARLAAIALVVVAIVLVAVAYKVLEPVGGTHVVVRGPTTFNFRYPGPLHRVPPRAGELARVEARGKGHLFLYSFAVRPMRLPPYKGQVSAALPAFASVHESALAQRFDSFQVVEEDRQRVVNEIAYAIFFTAKLGDRHLSGRDVLLPNPQPGAPNGVELEMVSTPAGGAGMPQSVANSGPLSVPFHTFRFGTSGP